MKNKIIIIPMIFLSLVGIFFFAIIVHEIFHSIHMKGAEAICFPTNLKINDELQNGYLIAYTQFNLSKYDGAEEYNTIRGTSEKIAGIFTPMIYIFLSFFFGYWVHKELEDGNK